MLWAGGVLSSPPPLASQPLSRERTCERQGRTRADACHPPLPSPCARTPLLRLYFLQYHLPPGEMHSIMLRLFSLLGDADRHSKLLTRLLALESYMRMREAFLKQAAAAADRDVLKLTDALLAEGNPGRAIGKMRDIVDGSTPSQNSAPLPSIETIEKARHSAAFRRCKLEIDALDATRLESKLLVIHKAFQSRCPLLARALFCGDKTLAKHDELLALLLHLRPVYLQNYFGRAQAVDLVTGSVPKRAAEWVFGNPDGSFGPNLEKFLRFDFANVNWLKEALKLQNMLYGNNVGSLNPADHYVVVSALELIRDFMHRTVVAAGGPRVPSDPNELTVHGLFEFYIAHVKKANCLDNVEDQRGWLLHSSQQILAALRLMGLAFRDYATSASLATDGMGPILTWDSAPIVNLLSRQTALNTLIDQKEAFKWARRDNGHQDGVLSLDRLPLLSAPPRKGDANTMPRKGDSNASSSASPARATSKAAAKRPRRARAAQKARADDSEEEWRTEDEDEDDDFEHDEYGLVDDRLSTPPSCSDSRSRSRSRSCSRSHSRSQSPMPSEPSLPPSTPGEGQ